MTPCEGIALELINMVHDINSRYLCLEILYKLEDFENSLKRQACIKCNGMGRTYTKQTKISKDYPYKEVRVSRECKLCRGTGQVSRDYP
jgi:hypothetical protein